MVGSCAKYQDGLLHGLLGSLSLMVSYISFSGAGADAPGKSSVLTPTLRFPPSVNFISFFLFEYVTLISVV